MITALIIHISIAASSYFGVITALIIYLLVTFGFFFISALFVRFWGDKVSWNRVGDSQFFVIFAFFWPIIIPLGGLIAVTVFLMLGVTELWRIISGQNKKWDSL